MTARDTAATTIGARSDHSADRPASHIEVPHEEATAAQRPPRRRTVMLTPDIADVLAGIARESCS